MGAGFGSLRTGDIDHLDELKAAYAVERANLYPIRSWDDLAAEVGADKLVNFESIMDQNDVLVSGLAYKGSLYLKPCKSAAGPMPYCDRMRFGVWSVTKSAAGAVALLRLAQKYGPDVFDAKIKDYVTITAPHQGWDDVTFGDALDMATGVGFGTAKRDPNIILDGYFEGSSDAWAKASSEGRYWPKGSSRPIYHGDRVKLLAIAIRISFCSASPWTGI